MNPHADLNLTRLCLPFADNETICHFIADCISTNDLGSLRLTLPKLSQYVPSDILVCHLLPKCTSVHVLNCVLETLPLLATEMTLSPILEKRTRPICIGVIQTLLDVPVRVHEQDVVSIVERRDVLEQEQLFCMVLGAYHTQHQSIPWNIVYQTLQHGTRDLVRLLFQITGQRIHPHVERMFYLSVQLRRHRVVAWLLGRGFRPDAFMCLCIATRNHDWTMIHLLNNKNLAR